MTAPLSLEQFDFLKEEKKQLKRSGQIPEPGYSGMGYFWQMYPLYVGTYQGTSTTPDVAPETLLTQATPDSKLGLAAQEAGATATGENMAANTLPAGN
jgi:hypothetical protein